MDRELWNPYPLTMNNLSDICKFKASNLISDSNQKAIEIILWFFERFGWLNPSIDVIKQDMKNLLSGRF